MNKETLALILVMGIAGLVILAFVLNDAYGHIPTETSQSYTRQFLPIVHMLQHILEEEKKQTALLDHIDCIINENHRYSPVYSPIALGNCGGYPLNVTGVWHP